MNGELLREPAMLNEDERSTLDCMVSVLNDDLNEALMDEDGHAVANEIQREYSLLVKLRKMTTGK